MGSNEKRYEAVVVGGGINGLSSLYHLQRLGAKTTALIEQFQVGHRLGSSHGASRITRSTYPDADYVQLMTLVHREEWPRLEMDTNSTLIHPCPGCFFGPPGSRFESYCQAVEQAGANVELIDPAEATRRFPLFRFDDVSGVLHDHTAGVVDAAGTVAALERTIRARGADVFVNTKVLEMDAGNTPVRVVTPEMTILAERLVVAAGPWTARLVPSLRRHLHVARQTVGYFNLDAPEPDYALGRFPVWVYLGDGENNVYYGLPPFGGLGIKVAQHVTSGREDEPFETIVEPDASAAEPLRQFLAEHLSCPVSECVKLEHCLYTNTATEDFILDRLPGNPAVVVGAGFSGHSFKFAPWTGRMLAEMVLGNGSVDACSAKILSKMRLPA